MSEAAVKGAYLHMMSAIERSHRCMLDVIKDEFERSGRTDMNPVQALIIFHMGQDELTASELKTRGYYLGSNVSYNLKKLVELGFVAHARSKVDRRAVKISLTAKGHEVREIVDGLFTRHTKTLESVGKFTVEDFEKTAVRLLKLERYWVDQIRYRL